MTTCKTLKNRPGSKNWSREIDQLVYQVYGLTEEEFRIVEGEGK